MSRCHLQCTVWSSSWSWLISLHWESPVNPSFGSWVRECDVAMETFVQGERKGPTHYTKGQESGHPDPAEVMDICDLRWGRG